MQISKACHLCMTNNKNNVKLFYWPFVCISCTSGEDLKKKNSLYENTRRMCLKLKIFTNTHNTVHLCEEYCKVH